MTLITHPVLEEFLQAGRATRTGELETLLGEAGVQTSVHGDELVLDDDIRLLDEELIQGELAGTEGDINLEVHRVITSTNDVVMSRLGEPGEHTRVIFAETQTAGRGRRGRSWVSPFGRNIYVTVGRFANLAVGDLGGLSLAVAVVVVQALRDEGLKDVGVKWPNDVLLDGGKLSGTLVELRAADERGVGVVVGVGVNLALDHAAAALIDQPWSHAATQRQVDRNRLGGRLAAGIIAAIAEFEQAGLSPFLPRWREFSLFAGQRVRVLQGETAHEGIEQGVSAEGELLVETSEGLMRFNSGEVSLRPLDGG